MPHAIDECTRTRIPAAPVRARLTNRSVAAERPGAVLLPSGHQLRPVAGGAAGIDHRRVLACQQRLWALLGRPADETPELPVTGSEAFLYGLHAPDGAELLGCVQVERHGRDGSPADVTWWLLDRLAGTDLDATFDAVVRAWAAEHWCADRVRLIGRDARWQQWLADPLTSPHPRAGTPDPGPARGARLPAVAR